LTIAATNINLSGSTVDVGNITITLDNLSVAGYTVYNGTLTMHTTGSNAFQVVANLNTNQGAVNMTLTVQTPTNTRIIVSTPTPGTIAGYTVTLTNVTIDTGVSHPVGGSATVSQGGSSVTVSFTP
jgi:NO-binding membrane sensor protein with MHYT domain